MTPLRNGLLTIISDSSAAISKKVQSVLEPRVIQTVLK